MQVSLIDVPQTDYLIMKSIILVFLKISTVNLHQWISVPASKKVKSKARVEVK